MQNTEVQRDVATPHVTPTHGATQPTATSTTFGTNRSARTFGLGVVIVESTSSGITSINVKHAVQANHHTVRDQMIATRTRQYVEIMRGEYLLEVQLYVSASQDRINAVCFVTNQRRSQWFGICAGVKETIAASVGCYILMLHGANGGDTCQQLGAYCVPLTLRGEDERRCELVGRSTTMGTTRFDAASESMFDLTAVHIHAVVFCIGDVLHDMWTMNAIEYRRHLAVRETPLCTGTVVLVLVEDELITGLRASVASSGIQSIQLVTTLRTTEWFGPAPSENTNVEYRSIEDQPTATHIGGIFGMDTLDPWSIESIGVIFYRR